MALTTVGAIALALLFAALERGPGLRLETLPPDQDEICPARALDQPPRRG
jgi:hypothetical protein